MSLLVLLKWLDNVGRGLVWKPIMIPLKDRLLQSPENHHKICNANSWERGGKLVNYWMLANQCIHSGMGWERIGRADLNKSCLRAYIQGNLNPGIWHSKLCSLNNTETGQLKVVIKGNRLLGQTKLPDLLCLCCRPGKPNSRLAAAKEVAVCSNTCRSKKQAATSPAHFLPPILAAWCPPMPSIPGPAHQRPLQALVPIFSFAHTMGKLRNIVFQLWYPSPLNCFLLFTNSQSPVMGKYQSMVMLEMHWGWGKQTPWPSLQPRGGSTKYDRLQLLLWIRGYRHSCSYSLLPTLQFIRRFACSGLFDPGESLVEEPGYVGMQRESTSEEKEKVKQGEFPEQGGKAERWEVKSGRGIGNRGALFLSRKKNMGNIATELWSKV